MAITPGGRPGDSTPLGKKPGPRQLTDYTREIAHALMRKYGWDESHAIAVARNAQKKWRRGGGKVRPQVRAGAAKSLGEQAVLDHVKSLANGKSMNKQDTTLAVKQRPGSIAKGPGAGKFPITDQASLDAAVHLMGRAKGVSRAAVKAHIVSAAKAKGLTLPASWTADKNLSHDIDLDWAAWNAAHKGKKSLKKMKKGQSDAFAAVARAQAKANATRGGGSVKAKAKPSGPKLTAKTAIKQAQAKKKFKGTPGMQAIAKLAAKNGINLSNEISLGKDGSKWKHGYIPENPAAVALKAHKTPGGSKNATSTSAGRVKMKKAVAPSSPNWWATDEDPEKLAARAKKAYTTPESLQKAEATSKMRQASHAVALAKARDAAKRSSKAPSYKELLTKSVASRQKHADSLGVHKTSSGSGVVSGDAAKARNAALAEKGIRDTIKSDHPMGASRDYQGRDVMVVGHAGRKVKVSDSHNRTTKLVLPHTLSATSKNTSIHISDPAKIKNAATMFGTGSKQHKAAIARFGAKKSGK